MRSTKTRTDPSGAGRRPVDPFAVLGVDRRADDAAVKRAYFLLVRQHPPETDPEHFQVIRAAYEQLSTAEGRARANLFLIQPPPALPNRRQPAYDLRVHHADIVRLALELRLAQLSLRNDYREPDLPTP